MVCLHQVLGELQVPACPPACPAGRAAGEPAPVLRLKIKSPPSDSSPRWVGCDSCYRVPIARSPHTPMRCGNNRYMRGNRSYSSLAAFYHNVGRGNVNGRNEDGRPKAGISYEQGVIGAADFVEVSHGGLSSFDPKCPTLKTSSVGHPEIQRLRHPSSNTAQDLYNLSIGLLFLRKRFLKLLFCTSTKYFAKCNGQQSIQRSVCSNHYRHDEHLSRYRSVFCEHQANRGRKQEEVDEFIYPCRFSMGVAIVRIPRQKAAYRDPDQYEQPLNFSHLIDLQLPLLANANLAFCLTIHFRVRTIICYLGKKTRHKAQAAAEEAEQVNLPSCLEKEIQMRVCRQPQEHYGRTVRSSFRIDCTLPDRVSAS